MRDTFRFAIGSLRSVLVVFTNFREMPFREKKEHREERT